MGDEDGDFEPFYERTRGTMVRLAALLVGPAHAEDLVQDAYARALLRWPSIDHPAGYVRTAVVNACRSELRRRRLLPRLTGAAGPATTEQPDYLLDALARLPARQRVAVVLRYYQQATEAEIGAALGCSGAAAGALLHRGVTALRFALA